MVYSTQILLLGAGELGTAFLPHLSHLPNTHVTIGVRTPHKYSELVRPNVALTPLDLAGSSDALARTFAQYNVVISATGFGQSPGTVKKLTEEILHAGQMRKATGNEKLWFFPWQWGVDYDITGDGDGLMPFFGEQKDVRDVLRARAVESNVTWTILSTGIFMSFLFEQFWGIVDREGPQITVRALRSWDHKVTVTGVDDIGKVLARVIAGEVEARDRILYAAGDTVSYAQLVTIVERVSGKEVRREEWTIPHLRYELAKDPDNLIKKYRLVFAREGVWWDKELTVNHELGIPVESVDTYTKGIINTK